jgi:hypothetical protein
LFGESGTDLPIRQIVSIAERRVTVGRLFPRSSTLKFVGSERRMRTSACFVALGVVLVAGLSLARGETSETSVSPWWLGVVAQAPVTMPLSAAFPSSGVLYAQPPAPVAVPSSGVLQPPPERRAVVTMPVRVARQPRSVERAAPTLTARHFVHRRTAAHRATKQKREDVARSGTSMRATTARTTTQRPIVVTAATVPTAVEPSTTLADFYRHGIPKSFFL